MKTVSDFNDYQILDMSDGMKLESWNGIKLLRPDPQIIWHEKKHPELWDKVDAKYIRSSSGGGSWEIYNPRLQDKFQVSYNDLVFNLKLMGFKHTGLFPEQAYNWNLISDKIKNSKRKVKVLNLFSYTGAASISALKAGASVVQVDSSRGMTDWAKDNVISNHLDDKPIRFIVDDCLKFVKREIRRGNKYDIILMDPPSFGRGSKNEVWNIEDGLYELIKECSNLLCDDPIMFLINSYSTGLSKTIIENILNIVIVPKYNGVITSDELGIKMKDSNLYLPCGVFVRWEKEHYDR